VQLNLGCGSSKITGAINVDLEEICKPDVIANFIHSIPFGEEKIDKVFLFHTIEHIPEKSHHTIFSEIWRVLKIGGELLVSYPEFVKVAQNFIDNYRGMRGFWKNTIYGRQLYPSDFHVALMYTPEFIEYLKQEGFEILGTFPEPMEDFNTIVKARKVEKKFFTREELQGQLLCVTS